MCSNPQHGTFVAALTHFVDFCGLYSILSAATSCQGSLSIGNMKTMGWFRPLILSLRSNLEAIHGPLWSREPKWSQPNPNQPVLVKAAPKRYQEKPITKVHWFVQVAEYLNQSNTHHSLAIHRSYPPLFSVPLPSAEMDRDGFWLCDVPESPSTRFCLLVLAHCGDKFLWHWLLTCTTYVRFRWILVFKYGYVVKVWIHFRNLYHTFTFFFGIDSIS